jgi:hypothetical protein
MLCLFIHIDPRMVRSALMSIDDTHQYCVIWLEEYFKIYGDFSPNKDEVKLAVSRKKEIYDNYVSCKRQLDQSVVDAQKFYKIWNALFPRCVSRPWCDIPGKCNTCYEIDRMRREATQPEIQRSLRDAHLLHRGGLFMLERQE